MKISSVRGTGADSKDQPLLRNTPIGRPWEHVWKAAPGHGRHMLRGTRCQTNTVSAKHGPGGPLSPAVGGETEGWPGSATLALADHTSATGPAKPEPEAKNSALVLLTLFFIVLIQII